MKLTLDTSYINKSDNIQSLLDYASDLGIVTLDTSALYQNSEYCLGQCNLENFEVVTKTIMYDYTLSRHENFEKIKDTFYSSQRKLGYIELYGLLISSGNDISSSLHSIVIFSSKFIVSVFDESSIASFKL